MQLKTAAAAPILTAMEDRTQRAERALALTRDHLDATGGPATYVAVALAGDDALRAPMTVTALPAAVTMAERLAAGGETADETFVVGRQSSGRRVAWTVWDRHGQHRLVYRLEEIEETIAERRDALI